MVSAYPNGYGAVSTVSQRLQVAFSGHQQSGQHQSSHHPNGYSNNYSDNYSSNSYSSYSDNYSSNNYSSYSGNYSSNNYSNDHASLRVHQRWNDPNTPFYHSLPLAPRVRNNDLLKSASPKPQPVFNRRIDDNISVLNRPPPVGRHSFDSSFLTRDYSPKQSCPCIREDRIEEDASTAPSSGETSAEVSSPKMVIVSRLVSSPEKIYTEATITQARANAAGVCAPPRRK